MNSWIFVLRGLEDALVEARAVLGSPVAWLETVQLFGLETADPATAAGAIASVAKARGIAGAVALEGKDPNAARERALALACSAAEGEILFDTSTRARLDPELLFVRPTMRASWSLPVSAVALAPLPCRRSDCRDSAAA